MITMQINWFLHALFGGPSYPKAAPSVTEYSLMGFNINEMGMGPIGIAVMLISILPTEHTIW